MSKKFKLLIALTVAVLAMVTTSCTSLSSTATPGYTWNEIETEQIQDK